MSDMTAIVMGRKFLSVSNIKIVFLATVGIVYCLMFIRLLEG